MKWIRWAPAITAILLRLSSKCSIQSKTKSSSTTISMCRCDLSNVLFIVTANVFDTIPEPLKDRMEILRLSGYIQAEKIAHRHRIPGSSQPESYGSQSQRRRLSPKAALAQIINGYAREAGVRTLGEQHQENHAENRRENRPNKKEREKRRWRGRFLKKILRIPRQADLHVRSVLRHNSRWRVHGPRMDIDGRRDTLCGSR